MNKKDDVKAFKAPSPVLILVCVIVLCALASYVIPAGVFSCFLGAKCSKYNRKTPLKQGDEIQQGRSHSCFSLLWFFAQ